MGQVSRRKGKTDKAGDSMSQTEAAPEAELGQEKEEACTDTEAQEKPQREKFTWNKKYLTICLYAIIVVLASVLIIRAVMRWETTVAYIKKFFSIISPFLWGAFIAFLINPLVGFLENKVFGRIKGLKKYVKPRRLFALLISYLFVIVLLVLVVVYLVPQIGNSITEIFSQVPKWIEEADKWLMDFEKNNPQFDFEKINEYVDSLMPQIMDFSKSFVTGVVPLIFSTSISVVKVLINILIAIMVSVYILSDKQILQRGFKRILYGIASEKTGDVIMETLQECYHIFSQFVFGKAVDSFIIGCLCFIVMTIFQFPFTPIISLIVGLTNMIPYFGPFIGAVPGVILIFMVNPLQALFFIIMIVIIQQFDGLFLGPRILGETVGLRPLWIIFAITIGGSMGGVVGMFLGVPVIAVLYYLLDKLLNKLAKKRDVDIEKK